MILQSVGIPAILVYLCASVNGIGLDSQALTLEIQKNLGQLFPLFLIKDFSALTPITPFVLLPDLPDPLPLEDFHLTIDEDSELGETLFGDLQICNSSIVGLSTVTDEIEVSGELMIIWRIDASNLTFTGLHDVQFNFYNGDYVISGSGEVNIEIIDFFVKFGLRPSFPAWNRIGLNPFTLEIGFDSAQIYSENLIVNGETFDWAEFTSYLKPSFEGFWPGAKSIVEKTVQDEVNDLLMGCKFFDLLNENFECFSGNSAIERILSGVHVTKVDACPVLP